jgi:hypothetical protein
MEIYEAQEREQEYIRILKQTAEINKHAMNENYIASD